MSGKIHKERCLVDPVYKARTVTAWAEIGRLAALKKYPKGGFYGKSHTDEWKDNHSAIMKDKQSGNKNSQFGTMWITNDKTNTKIKKDETIPEGWRRGRI